MPQALLYLHGKGGNSAEADRFRALCPDCEVHGLDYPCTTPWAAAPVIAAAFDRLTARCGDVTIVANSIGAYFAMQALGDKKIRKALFISPVVDMEGLMLDMMTWAGVSEARLRREGEIPTDMGETLSWEYLQWVRAHPVAWDAPTEVLYAGGDALIRRSAVEAFCRSTGAGLTVMEEGEHWFHTDEQLAFLDAWLTRMI